MQLRTAFFASFAFLLMAAQIDPSNPANGLRLNRGKTFLLLMADASVVAVRARVSKATLNAAFTRGGGAVPIVESVRDPAWRRRARRAAGPRWSRQ